MGSTRGLADLHTHPRHGDAIGDEVKVAYTRHTALLLHRMTHNHSLEVREVTTIRLQAAQQARNTCPRWVLHQAGIPTDMNTRLWNHLQLLLRSPQTPPYSPTTRAQRKGL